MKNKEKKIVWQRHHITYEPEVTVIVTRAEHFYLTMLNRFSKISAGAKRAFRHILNNKPTRRRNE